MKEMMTRVDDFVRSEEAYKSTELPKGEAQDYSRKYFPPRVERARGSYLDKRRNDRRGDYRHKESYSPYVSPRQGGHPHGDFRKRETGRHDNYRPGLMALIKQPKEILATEHQLRLPPPPPLVGKPNRENADMYYDYHGEKSVCCNKWDWGIYTTPIRVHVNSKHSTCLNSSRTYAQ